MHLFVNISIEVRMNEEEFVLPTSNRKSFNRLVSEGSTAVFKNLGGRTKLCFHNCSYHKNFASIDLCLNFKTGCSFFIVFSTFLKSFKGILFLISSIERVSIYPLSIT